jgi:hypothetical protein
MVRRFAIYTVPGILLGLAAFAAEDPGGWTKAKWGMSEADLRAAFPEARRLDPPEPVNKATLTIDSVKLADIEFTVYFSPDPKGHLSRVILNPRYSADANDRVFQALENALVEKYGRASKTEEDNVTILQWRFPQTTIELTRVKLPGGNAMRLVHLVYRMRVPASDQF